MNNDLSIVIKHYSKKREIKDSTLGTMNIKTIGRGIKVKNIKEDFP